MKIVYYNRSTICRNTFHKKSKIHELNINGTVISKILIANTFDIHFPSVGKLISKLNKVKYKVINVLKQTFYNGTNRFNKSIFGCFPNGGKQVKVIKYK